MVLTGGVLFAFSFCLPQLSAREPSCAGCYIHTVQKEHLAIVSSLGSMGDIGFGVQPAVAQPLSLDITPEERPEKSS